jgi:predicted RNA binding protein YcfA (HicA-like mRNA interferase family)
MPKLPGISHAQAVRVFGKIGFRVAREGKHTIMSNGKVRLTIPRHTTINAFTMADIAHDAGLTPDQFKELL